MIKFFKKTNEKGSILVGSLMMLTVLLGFGIALVSVVLSSSIQTQRSYQNIVAQSYAEASIEKTMWELNNGVTPTCTPQCNYGNADVFLDIVDINAENKEVTATAYTPSYANAKATKKIRVKITATPSTSSIAFNYAIQGGSGGIEVSGSSQIDGNLYSNGSIDVSGSATVEAPGDVWAVTTVTYNDRDQIAGTITESPLVDPVPLPDVDIEAWENLASSGGTITGNYTPPNTGGYTDLGPKKITGNMSMSQSGEKINLLGPLYIQGDLNLSGSCEWKLDDSFGSNGTIVLVEGKISISGSVKFFGNSSGSYILFISTNAANTKGNPAISYTGSAAGKKLALYAINGAMKLGGSGKIIAMSGETLFIQ